MELQLQEDGEKDFDERERTYMRREAKKSFMKTLNHVRNLAQKEMLKKCSKEGKRINIRKMEAAASE
ncbi:hypothetical protein N665_1427s0001 [Sinapis alba]|nr:hypothetical protein N665_1427s0001 [Sinapis alba]